MKPITFILGFALLATSGCINMKVTDGTRPPTQHVDLFKNDQIPPRKFREIAELSVSGERDNEGRAEKRFIREAKNLGGDGLIFEVVPAKSSNSEYVFKGRVIVYQ